MLGPETYEAVRHEPAAVVGRSGRCAQNRRLFDAHPEQVWVLERSGDVFGYVTFWIFPEQSYGHIDNNAVRADVAGQGWATFMYRHVLDRFRELGLRFAHVDTGLDDAHIAARRAYEAVGFDRAVPIVEYWQALCAPGSIIDRIGRADDSGRFAVLVGYGERYKGPSPSSRISSSKPPPTVKRFASASTARYSASCSMTPAGSGHCFRVEAAGGDLDSVVLDNMYVVVYCVAAGRAGERAVLREAAP